MPLPSITPTVETSKLRHDARSRWISRAIALAASLSAAAGSGGIGSSPLPSRCSSSQRPPIPAGTRYLGVEVSGGVATVDLSREFESGGGSLSMISRVAQVVFTVTRIDGIAAG